MDLLQKYKKHGYFTSDLYYLLVKKKLCDVETFPITPSEYEKEMNMTTQQRLQSLNNIEIDNIVSKGTNTNDPILSFTPRLLVFQNFKPHEKVVAKFIVRNNSKNPTHLSMVFKESSSFFIKPVAGQFRSRLAPGISITFNITFLPMHYEDYTHRVTFYTDAEQYAFPIIAMGPRPVFDFPDIIKIPKTPLKIENHVLVPVHNRGVVPASFTLSCKCPFSVHPKSASISPGEKADIKVALKTMHLGEIRDILRAIFETGEVLIINLQGSTFLVSIELEKQVVRFFDTYNTMLRQQTFKITNKSEYVLTYMCMKNECVFDDFEEKVKLATMFFNVKESESAKCAKLVQYDVLSSDEHERVYTRIFCDEVHALVADESLLFQNTHFSITPSKGNLWPNKPTELTITFGPKQIGEFEAIIYFDIDGVLDRVPLRLSGISVPPSIQLNVETLNMDQVYINSQYDYEIIAINKGHINGVIEYREVPTLFGSIISCSTALHCLKPGDQEIFVVSFRNPNQGPYFEEINFIIRDTDVVLKLYLQGEVVYPTVTFSLPSLDFGMVSIGIPKTLELEVINESVVEVRCNVKISTDGPEVCSVKLKDYAVAPRPKPTLPQWPREFIIDPCLLVIASESRVLIKVTLIANLVRANQTTLELELEKSDSPPITLPITFIANVPQITIAPDIHMKACFVDYTYHQDIFIVCKQYRGYFTVYEMDYEPDKTFELQVGCLTEQGYIEPDSTLKLPITIRMSALGTYEKSLKLNIFGLSKPLEVCHVIACGMRPIVTCSPMALHWGQVKLLNKTQKVLTICNDSPVAVYYKAYLLNKDGRWLITPTEGRVDPEEESELHVSLYLIDTGNYTNKAVLQFENVKDILVPLSATGTGTSIVVGELRDKICLGRHFTKIPLDCKVVMENYGSRLHSLEWSEHYKAPKNKPLVSAFFNLDPRTFKLGPREKMELSINGTSHKEATVTENWYLVGSIEGINKKELLLECPVTAEFVDPKIEVSCNVIEFRHDYGPYSESYKITEIMSVKNVSKLPLDIEIIARPPFTFIHRSTYRIPQHEEEMTCGCITYDQSDINVQKMLTEYGPHKSQEFIDYLTNKPVEPHRACSLNFFNDINKLKLVFHTSHVIEERLEDQEVMKIQVLFDTTKHTTLKSKVYCDTVRIRFKGHKNKDTIRLIGKINYPNIFVLSSKVDFQCILNGSHASRSIKLENVTPLLDCFRFQWKKCSIRYIDMQPKFNIPQEALTSSRTTSQSSKQEEEISVSATNSTELVNVLLDTVGDGKTGSRDIYPAQDMTTISVPNLPLVRQFSKLDVLKVIYPMLKGHYHPEFKWANKFAKFTKASNDINDIFQLVPHRGMLKPGEAQYVHIMFVPPKNISVQAILECEVLGGPSEMIQVSGQSSDLIYTINSTVINFGIRSFHERASEELVITNVAPLPFQYKTYLNEPKFETELEGTILHLLPPEKQLLHSEVSEMQIVVRTGIVGYFNRTFLLEIGHFPHIPIQVFGWGCVPQVYISLPRAPVPSDSDTTLGYLAIPRLTEEYLQARSMFSSSPFQRNNDHVNSPLLDKCFEDPDFHYDWHICSTCDGYPSVMDIELVIERHLVVEHVKVRPELLTPYSTSNKMGPISGFYTKPYVIDFGVVITGSSIQCAIDIINYAPTHTKLHFARATHIPTWLSVKLCGKLNPGEVGVMEVAFSPTPFDFTELEQNVETSFNLEVPYGVTIPIQIKALCAVPYLTSNVKMLDFGSVRCGDKVVASIPLKNVGKPTCIWYVTLKLKAAGPAPMMVMDSAGKFEPGEGGWLSVSFKPTMEMLYEGLLIFRFHMNPKKMAIPILGQGLVPHVHIIGPNARFPPTLPWAQTSDIYFGLTNPCPFPIELIIAHSDEKWKEEEEIFQLLYKYYNKPEEILIPAVIPGTGWPESIVYFRKYFQDQVAKTFAEETAAAAKNAVKVAAQAKKEKKSPKASAKGQSSKSAQSTKDVQPVIRARTEAEIISDQIKTMKEQHVDPVKECFDVLDITESEESIDKPKGMLILLHGSPSEESKCQEIAYSIGKHLKIPTINVDLCIIEALCVCQCPARDILANALDESYELCRKKSKEDSELDYQPEDEFNDTQDEFEVIFKKVQYLCMNKITKTPRTKATEKRSKKMLSVSLSTVAALEAMGSTTLFKMDLTQELLIDFFSQPKFDYGFVVDSLTSSVIKNSQLVLTTILKCKPNILNIHLLLCQSDFAKWAHQYEESLRDAETVDDLAYKVYSEEEIEQIISTFEEMDADEYDNASPDLKAIYITHGLGTRRKKYLDKESTVTHGVEMKKDKPGKTAEYTSKATLTAQGSDAKKKNRREELRGKPTSEFTAMSNKYNEYYKLTYEPLINIANNWITEECDIGYPLYALNGQIAGATQKKPKRKSEVQLQVSEASVSERGFFLTLIMCPCLRYKSAIVNMFKYSPLVVEALKLEEPPDLLLSPVKRKEFTMLLPKVFPTLHFDPALKWRYLNEKPIKKCECNQLTDLNLLDDSTQDNVLHILSKWNCTCGKKMTSSLISTSDVPSASSPERIEAEEPDEIELLYPQPLPLYKVPPIPTLGKRLVLQPGDLVRCKFSFSPRDEGNFSIRRYVEVSGWPDSRININANGICDLPRLDSRPKKMFEKFVRRTIDKHVYKLTFLDDLKLFEFGPIFVGSNRIYEEEYSIDLKNASLITADVVIEFLEDTSVFQIDKNLITLEPGCRDKLVISAAPAEVGLHTTTLLFCVKDNPEIVMVNIACTGVRPILEILPHTKVIEYGKHLLYRRADDRFIVKNDSILPVMWKIRNAADFVEDFIIAQTTGIVPRYDNQVVPVTYIACRVDVISNKVLTIDIYDAEGRGDPMIIDDLHLSAECYDVMIECMHENPSDNCLNYGNVKVNSTVYKEMYLLNRGKYNIYFKLKKVKNFPEPSLLKSFEVVPECGVIPPSVKLVPIEFECTPTTSMNLVNVPAYTCSLLDGSKQQVVVAKFPVTVTIASFYNTFTLFPFGELNFNVIAVGTRILKEVILNNTSKCPFTYEIVLPKRYQMDVENVPSKKDNKIRHPPLQCGNFIIISEDNLLTPGTSRTIQIQFHASDAKKFEETIHFIISDTCPAEASGVPLNLVGTGAMPTLDLWNLETTFREHIIVKNLSEYKVPESSPHCVFAENSVTLHFFCVTVNTKYEAYIDLYNNGLVACALTMKLQYQSQTNQEIFSLDKYETHIEPLLHKNLGIIFSPKALKEYRAVLEIKLKLLDNNEQSFKICLIGEGVIPRICLITPTLRHHRIAMLQLPVTCLGSVTNKIIRFKNVSPVKSYVVIDVIHTYTEDRPIFWITTKPKSEHMILLGNNDEMNQKMKLLVGSGESATLNINYNPQNRGRNSCDVKISIIDNAYEYYTVICEGEAFMEDVILLGLEMLPMDLDLETLKSSPDGTPSVASTMNSRTKSKSADKRKRASEDRRTRRSITSARYSDGAASENSILKYLLDYGGCELASMQRRSVVMVNNSEKVYKFSWAATDHIVIKPSLGFISPGEEKDLEIIFFSAEPITLKKELLTCTLIAISDDSLRFDMKGTTWDNRQIVTSFERIEDMNLNQRKEEIMGEQTLPQAESFLGAVNIVILYSAMTAFVKYNCTLTEEMPLPDTVIYQTRPFVFTVKNVGVVPIKIRWSFEIDDSYPTRIDKNSVKTKELGDSGSGTELEVTRAESIAMDPNELPIKDSSNVTLFSGNIERRSVDTWFEIELPFKIEPILACLNVDESQKFTVTFTPEDAFDYKVRLKSFIDNLDPYDQNISCKLLAKSLIPYVHLEIEESDYLKSGRRKITGMALPEHISVLEFNVLGWGCYKKSFNVINPTSEAYEFIFEMVMSDKPELIPVHCDSLKAYIEGGTSINVTFTFSPTAPGVTESQWKFIIPIYNLVMNLLVVGIVREPDVVFVPTILVIRNSLVGFTTTNVVVLKNNETDSLKFEFKGNSLCNESGKTPVIVEPERGTLKPRSETPIKIIYTPIHDGPLSFKIFCSVTYLTSYLTLCVKALSYSIKPQVTYNLIGNKHLLISDAVTNIHLDQTASTYERTVPFTIRNDGSATFFFDWHYNTAHVKKYLELSIEPKSGHVTPGNDVECTLYFKLVKVPVKAFPIRLSISDGPEYYIQIHAEIEKPLYHFSCMEYDFEKCFVNAPDSTYKKHIFLTNDDKEPLIVDLNFSNLPELYVECYLDKNIPPGKRLKISIYFRPKHVRQYEFKLEFWVNSLCEEILTIRGQGIPLLFDLYEGCQKSFDLGYVKVGEKIVRTIEVMNHSKRMIDASFIFKDMYPVVEDTTKSDATSVCLSAKHVPSTQTDIGPTRVQMLQQYKDDKVRAQISMDIQNALSSLKVVPNSCKIKPYKKVPLKIQFKPVGMISTLNVQLNMRVLNFERPLVRLSGCATGMSFCFNQSSLQFGRVRRHGCKILKVMLMNQGDFGARFWWQPLISDEFVISPQQGTIAAHTNVAFTITFRPLNHNPFIKVWASCNVENYKPMELCLNATCMDFGTVTTKTMYIECPTREKKTDYVQITNPTDDLWLILSDLSEGPFDTLKEFNVEPNSTLEVAINFRPKTIGKHEAQAMFWPIGDSVLYITLIGVATQPNPNGSIAIKVTAKDFHTEELLVYNITEEPETYIVRTEVAKIVPDKFEGHYEIKQAETIKTWGEAAATCRWTFVCYEECEMELKVVFINEKSYEYQFYLVSVTVTPSPIVDTLTFVCRAREKMQKELVIANPLNNDAQYSVRCENLEMPESLDITRNSEAILVMTYSPLVIGEVEDYLEVKNELVGTLLYKVILKCLPAKVKDLEVSTSFGTSTAMRLKVENRTDIKADFECKFSHRCMQADRDIYTLGPNEKGKFMVLFEPTEMGTQMCTVSFYSPTAGEFKYNVKGTATTPKPQGPYEIMAGGQNTIKFKNVFPTSRTFKIYVDKEEFYVKTLYEPIPAKKEIQIYVHLNARPRLGWDEVPTGTLTIESCEMSEPKVQWTYFLQGV